MEIPLKQVSHLLQRTQRSFNLQGKSFWWGRNANDIVFTGYLQKEHIINIEHLRKTIETKRPGKLTKWFLLHRVNAPAHNYLFSVTAVCAVCDCGFELVDQLPYSPDYHLLPNMKRDLAGNQYCSNDDVISAVDNFLTNMMKVSSLIGSTL